MEVHLLYFKCSIGAPAPLRNHIGCPEGAPGANNHKWSEIQSNPLGHKQPVMMVGAGRLACKYNIHSLPFTEANSSIL